LKPEEHIYVHVPFCLKKCLYCSFYSVPYAERAAKDYLKALAAEIKSKVPSGAKPMTVYIGGGTPTALSCRELSKLMQSLQTHFDLSGTEEFTIEANPGTLSMDKIKILKESTVNRISLGIQSFDDMKLEMLGRVHTSAQATKAFTNLQNAGFSNLSIDLIYGVPGDSQTAWQKDLNSTAALRPAHVSTYCLSIEPGTLFSDMLARGELALPDEGLQRRLYEEAVSYLNTKGYDRYELSNFGLPEFCSRHNLAAWRYKPYLGLGPSAVSFDGITRSRNPAVLTDYLEKPAKPEDVEELSPSMQAAEIMMLALRTQEGITAAEFKARSGLDLHETYGSVIEQLIDRALLEEIQRADTTAFRIILVMEKKKVTMNGKHI